MGQNSQDHSSLLKKLLESARDEERPILHQLSLDPYQPIQDKASFVSYELVKVLKGWDGLIYLMLTPISCSRNWDEFEWFLVVPVSKISGGIYQWGKEDLSFSSYDKS